MKKILCLILMALMVCVCFAGCGNSTPDGESNTNNDTGNDVIIEDIMDVKEEILDEDVSDETLLDFENFYFEINGIKFEKFETFGSYLDLNPTPWDGHSVEDVLSLEECNFKVEDNGKYNDFSLSFYNDYEDDNVKDRDVIVTEVFVYGTSEKPLDITFAQGVKLGDKASDVLKKYGKEFTRLTEDGKRIETLVYQSEPDWIEIEFEFDENERLRNFRINYDVETYEEMLEENKED